MDNIITLDNIKQENIIQIDKNIDFVENRNKTEFTNVLGKVIENGTNYIIKSLPISDNLKDIAIDIKNAFKTRDFKEVLKTAVNSSIREGLEVLNMPKDILSDITKISKVAFKGGLSQAISAGIDIVSEKYLKNNIFSPVIDKVLGEIKTYIGSVDFKNKLDLNISKLIDKTTKFNELCNEWYNSYEKFDIFSMNNICKTIKKMQSHIVNNKDCITQSNIIENMTKLVNSKHSKLSPIQMKICGSI